MISSATRDRLRLVRRGLPALPTVSAHRQPSFPSTLPLASVPNARVLATLGLERGYEVHTPLGSHWQIDIAMSLCWPRYWDQFRAWEVACREKLPQTEGVDPRERVWGDFRTNFPASTVFLDLETCGFAGSPIFLAGIVRIDNADSDRNDSPDGPRELVLSQLWARGYGEEPSLLWGLHQYLQNARVLVTFNGKSFDWPQVVDRSLRHKGIDPQPQPTWTHLDVLHHARRRFKTQVSNCRLQTLEREICGLYRWDDLPSHLVPEAYHRYALAGEADSVDRILQHNALDLVTLLQLALRLSA